MTEVLVTSEHKAMVGNVSGRITDARSASNIPSQVLLLRSDRDCGGARKGFQPGSKACGLTVPPTGLTNEAELEDVLIWLESL